jgi:hypothetical protein
VGVARLFEYRVAGFGRGVLGIFVSGWLFVLLAVHPALHPQGSSSSSEYELVIVPLAYLSIVMDEAEVFLALLAAHLAGGVVSGRLSPGAPASNGAATAAVCAPVGIAWLL